MSLVVVFTSISIISYTIPCKVTFLCPLIFSAKTIISCVKRIIKNYNVIKKIKPSKNVVIGFGITEKTISNLRSADGLVVGSAICREITRSLKDRQNPVTNVSKLVRKLKNKII